MIYGGQEVGTPHRLTFPFTSTKIDWSINPEFKEEYKRILKFRNSSAAIRRGKLTSYNTADVCAFVKQAGKEKVFVITNMRNRAIDFSIPAVLAKSSWTNAMDGRPVTLTSAMRLEPYTYLVLKK